MAGNDGSAYAPRRYRPSYSYGPSIPHSASTKIEYAASPFHAVAPISSHVNFPTSSNRRRTTNTFNRPDPGHSAPTVARSGLTASASTNDLSLPSPKSQRLRFPNLKRNFTPSRIPTPIFDANPTLAPRHVSTPVLPSQRKKENVPPKTLRLLGPISPSRNQPPIPKSRTMGMLSSLTSSFSRSSLNVSSSRQSSARTSDPTISITSTSSPPLPMFTTNIRQIHTVKPSSYWCGRFQSLHDRFHNDVLEAALADPKAFQRYLDTRTPSPSLTNSKFKEKTRDNRGKAKNKASSEQEDIGRKSQNEIFIMQDEERRVKRVFLHLEALCVTVEAKKSLWDWQLRFARRAGNERFLPVGGRMVDEKVGWVSRMGRAMSGGMTNGGTGTSLGRRSGLGALGRRKGSVMGLAR